RGVGQSPLEDDVDIHQAVTNDRVTEAQRDQYEPDDRERHPRTLFNVQNDRKDVEQRKWHAANQRSAGEPFQLLPQNARGSFTIAFVENEARPDETQGQKAKLVLV